MSKVRPLQNFLLLRPVDPPRKTAGGLHLPDKTYERPVKAVVVAAGPGRRLKKGAGRLPMQVREGDTVVYGKYAGTRVVVDGENFLVMRDTELLGVLD